MKDLLVVGGGPSGLATAVYAAQAGLDVSVWERHAGVLDKACGEGLMPGAVSALSGIGIDPPGVDLAGIRYVRDSRTVAAPFRSGPGRGVRRTALHASMRTAVAASGVVVEQRAVTELSQEPADVVVNGDRFRYVVAADGLHSPVRRRLGLDGPRARLRRFGLRRHFRLTPWTSFVEVHWAPQVEAYVTPVASDLVGVALLTRERGSFDQHFKRLPSLQDRFRHAEAVGDVLGAGPLLQHVRARVAGRVLLVGDASGYIDALTGEGIALGVAQARSAVSAIVGDVPARYEDDWLRVTRRYRVLTASLLVGTQLRPLRQLLVPTAQFLPRAFGTIVESLARPA
ncbi:MAG TPA: NAD(P)/FAD-dependent oxidoreductase [Lapillicoccus sp.]|nr:NAD(P)/FAD-dependent oxidoreductase [Lapillicoccus sp.]